jgi:hypothetical protein
VSSIDGLIPQLVFCCIYQEITNRRYIAESLEVDYADGSISLGIQATNDPLTPATLQLEISFPIAQQSPLLRRYELAERVSSVTDLHTDNIAIAREVSYPRIGDYQVPTKPIYLSGRNDTLERRIVWLCQQIVNLDSWLNEWNQFALICDYVLTTTAINNINLVELKARYMVTALRSLAIAYTDFLISQLATFPIYREVRQVQDIGSLVTISPLPIANQGEISGVASESSFVDSYIDTRYSSSELDYGDYIKDDDKNTPPNAPNQDPINSLPDC